MEDRAHEVFWLLYPMLSEEQKNTRAAHKAKAIVEAGEGERVEPAAENREDDGPVT